MRIKLGLGLSGGIRVGAVGVWKVVDVENSSPPIISIDHETGDLTQYSSTVADSGDLSVSDTAALAGTGYGLSLVIDDTTAIYGEYNFVTPVSAPPYLRFRFYIDPNSLTMANNNTFTVVRLFNSTPSRICDVVLAYTTASGYMMAFIIYNDADASDFIGASNYYAITDAPHYVECLITRASTADANDGSAQWWVDGASKASETGKDVYNKLADFDAFRIGAGLADGIDAGTSGTFYLDELIVNDDGSEIGPVAGQSFMFESFSESIESEINHSVPTLFGIPISSQWTWDNIFVPVIEFIESK